MYVWVYGLQDTESKHTREFEIRRSNLKTLIGGPDRAVHIRDMVAPKYGAVSGLSPMVQTANSLDRILAGLLGHLFAK